ncbi:MAG: HlyD family efflux transporter periplasmic adaptor subunit [Candidatus Solibacter sp.]|nr:HlyD family efflux transporter periplasmic adaptor subunit [Candidatus Solibacter sp.]
MSASPNSPWIQPERPLGHPAKPPVTRARWPIYILLAVLVLAAAWFLRPQPPKAVAAPSVATIRATRGVIQTTRRLAGSITASRFINVGAPVLAAPDTGRGLTLIFLAESGTRVKQGQLIAEIDSQDIKDHLVDVESMLLQAQLEIARRKAVLVAQMEYLYQRLRIAKATMERAQLDARAIPVRNAIAQEILRLAADEYREAYEEAIKQTPLTEQRQLFDLKLYEMSYDHDVRHRDRHLLDYRRCSIRAPIDGMVVMQTTYRGGQMNQIKVGDRLSPGQPFMRVVDPASMQLDATMNQAESELIRLSQRAIVHFDAFPDIVVKGRVQSVGALATGGGRRTSYNVRSIPVRLALETVDPRVIPDLSASGDVAIAESAAGLIVPLETLSASGGKTIVYVKQGDAFVSREVEIAGTTYTHAALASGIQEGEEVALQPALAAAVIH